MGKKKYLPAPGSAQAGSLDLKAVSFKEFQGLADILLAHGDAPAFALDEFQDIGAAEEFTLNLAGADTPGLKLLQHPIKGPVDKAEAVFFEQVGGQLSVTDGSQPPGRLVENHGHAGTQDGDPRRGLFPQI